MTLFAHSLQFMQIQLSGWLIHMGHGIKYQAAARRWPVQYIALSQPL